MPRNGVGVYNLPSGNPVLSGTTVAASWANSTMPDLGNEITNSLPRDGSAPMNGPLKFVDGAVATPSITFSSETATGFYREGGTQLSVAVAGGRVAKFSLAGLDNVHIGSVTRGTGAFTTLAANGAATLTNTLAVTGASTFASTVGINGATTIVGNTSITGNLTIVGTTSGISKTMVGLPNVDNTTDVTKPVSAAQQAAIDAMYELAAPAGAVEYFAMNTPPARFIKANGAAVSRTTYARLFAAIGTFYGAGDGTTTFNVPDLRGVFPRGHDDGRTLDPGRAFGSYQDSANLSHAHGISDPGHAHSVYDPGHLHGASSDAQGEHVHDRGTQDVGGGYSLDFNNRFVGEAVIRGNVGYATGAAGNHAHNIGIGASGTGIGIYGAGTGVSVNAAGGTESRPRNVALMACIRY